MVNKIKIPEKIKLGGIILAVEQTENLKFGVNSYMGEYERSTCAIRIAPAPQQSMEATLWHELVHAIFRHIGWFDDFDNETKVEALANALYALVKDNPELFKE